MEPGAHRQSEAREEENMQVESQYTPLIFLSSSVFVKTKRVSWYLFLIFALAVPDLCHLIPLAKYSPSVALLFRHSFIHVDSFFPHSRGDDSSPYDDDDDDDSSSEGGL